jgi:hypothetical protein
MTELEKLRAARESWARWQEEERIKSWSTWLDSEIARLSDPHAEAKEIIDGWGRFGTVDKGVKVREYVRYIESELAKAKAAAEPLDPKRVYKTACELTWGDARRFIEGYEDAEPYELSDIMTELEKLRAAKEVWTRYQNNSESNYQWYDPWIDSEIARLEDPHAEARKALENFKDSYFANQRAIHDLFHHLESELAKAKAAAEPLDPKRVLATAAKLTDVLDVSDERKQSIRSALVWSSNSAEPYEVTE